MGLNLSYNKENFIDEEFSSDRSNKFFNSGLEFLLNYYFSPQLKLSAATNIYDNNGWGYGISIDNYFYMYNSISLTYAIF